MRRKRQCDFNIWLDILYRVSNTKHDRVERSSLIFELIPYLQVLAGHVIPGSWYTAGLFTGDKLKNWNGDFITVDKNQNGEIRFRTKVENSYRCRSYGLEKVLS